MGIRLSYLNTAEYTKGEAHGSHAKDMLVLHETVSPDLPGLADIVQVEKYLQEIGYGIHGMTDLEGHCAWAYGHGDDIFYQCGGVNERSVGIEQVSYIPMMLEKGIYTMAQAKLHWAQRTAQLHATARIIAAWHQVAPSKHRINYSSGLTAGVTTHWDVSQHFAESEGHTDCHPAHKGGYYPALEVIDLARGYVSLGYHF